jgi:hypothetical protein
MDTQTSQNTAAEQEVHPLLLKTLNGNAGSPYQSMDYEAYLPTQGEDGSWTPGDWTPPVEGSLEMCQNGYHVTDVENLHEWIQDLAYFAEPGGWNDGDDIIGGQESEKYACRTIRLVKPVDLTYDDVLLLLCDVAETRIDQLYKGSLYQRYVTGTVMPRGRAAYDRSVPGLMVSLEDLVRNVREAVLSGRIADPETRPSTTSLLHEWANRLYSLLPSAMDTVANYFNDTLGNIGYSNNPLYQAMQISHWEVHEENVDFAMSRFKELLAAKLSGGAGPQPVNILRRTQPGYTPSAQDLAEEIERARWHGAVLNTAKLTLFKTLSSDGTSPYQSMDYDDYLPTQGEDGSWTPGDWTPPIHGELRMCQTGYHLTDTLNLMHWFNERVFLAEVAGDTDGKIRIGVDIIGVNDESVVTDSKVACRSIRLVRPLNTGVVAMTGWGLEMAEFMLSRLTSDAPSRLSGAALDAFNQFPALLAEVRQFATAPTNDDEAEALVEKVHTAYQSVPLYWDTPLGILERVAEGLRSVVEGERGTADTIRGVNLARHIQECVSNHKDDERFTLREYATARLVAWMSSDTEPEPMTYPTV